MQQAQELPGSDEAAVIEALAGDLSSLKGRARRSMSTLVFRYGAAIAINLVGTIMLSRLVGPGTWGVFAIAQVVCLSSQELFARGVASYLIKKSGPLSASDIRSTFALQHLVGLAFLLGTAAIAAPASHWYRSQHLLPLLIAAAIASYSYAWRSIPVALLERDLEYVRVALIEVSEAAVFCATAISLAWLGHPIAGLALALALRSVVPTLLAFALRPVRPQMFFCRDTISTVADFGFAVTGGSLMNIAVLFVPVLLVGKLAGVNALGLAQMAFSLFRNLLFGTAAVLRLSFSTFSRLAEFPGELQRTVNNNLVPLSGTLVPAIALFAGLSPLWTRLILGPMWHELPVVLLAMAPGYFLAAVFWGVMNPALVVAGKHRQVAVFLIAFTGAYVALTWLALPRLGAVGVAVAFSATHVLLYPFLFWLYRRTYSGLRLSPALAEIGLGTVFMVGIWAASQRGFAAACMVLVPYAGLWYLRNSNLLKAGIGLLQRASLRWLVETGEET